MEAFGFDRRLHGRREGDRFLAVAQRACPIAGGAGLAESGEKMRQLQGRKPGLSREPHRNLGFVDRGLRTSAPKSGEQNNHRRQLSPRGAAHLYF